MVDIPKAYTKGAQTREHRNLLRAAVGSLDEVLAGEQYGNVPALNHIRKIWAAELTTNILPVMEPPRPVSKRNIPAPQNDNSPVISKIVKPPPPSRRTRSPAREQPQTQYKPAPPKREKSPAAAPRHKKAVPPLPAKNFTSGSVLDSIATNPSARKSLRHAVYSQYVHDSPTDSGQHLSPTLEDNHVPRTSTGRQTRGFSYLGAGGINPADIQLRKTAGDRKGKPLETQF